MRILLANAVNKNDFSYSMPLSLAYLAGYLRDKSALKDIYVKSVSTSDASTIEKVMSEFRPGLVGISSTSPNFFMARAISGVVKNFSKDTTVVMGGQHITLTPDDLADSMDFGVIGEGEVTFLELVEGLRGGKRAFHDVPGLCFRENGRLLKTARRPFVENLDDIPHPERRILNSTNNTLFSSRGCPYLCSFCSSSVIWDRKIRFHSAEYIFDEMQRLYRKGHSVQWFADDLFVCNKKRISAIVRLLKENNLYKKIVFFAEGRSNLIDDQITALIKELNVFRVSFGFESGDDEVLKKAKGGGMDVASHKRASDICRRHGIFVDGYFMVGFPGDNRETIRKTYEFARQYCDFVGEPTLVTVFPGTELRDTLLQETSIDYSKIHLEKFMNNSYLPVDEDTVFCKNLTREEILNFKESFKALEKVKKRKFFLHFALKLLFSKSFHLNARFLLRNTFLRYTNPKREFVSETIKLT